MTKVNENWVAYMDTNFPGVHQSTYAKITGYSDASISKYLKIIRKAGLVVTKDMNFLGKEELLANIKTWEEECDPLFKQKFDTVVDVPLNGYPPEIEFEDEPVTGSDNTPESPPTTDDQSVINFMALVGVSDTTVDYLVSTIKSMAQDGDKFNIAISINRGTSQ